MKVVEIFKSLDGEGLRAGFPATFIRLEGCNLRCSYCDTRYSYQNAEYTIMTPEEIYTKVYKLGCNRITLTGGEPLIHEDVEQLVDILTQNGFEVNIETNGSINISNYINKPNVIITMDYKCPSSGMCDEMLLTNLPILRRGDVLKFVVGSKEDLDACRDLIKRVDCQIYISPVFGKIELKEIAEYILEHDMQNCRLQVQLHKIVWDPAQRGV